MFPCRNRESNIVSKTFTVEWAPGQEKYETDDESINYRISRDKTSALQVDTRLGN